MIQGLIQKAAVFGDATTLSQFETRIDAINDDSRRRLNAENDRLLKVLDAGDKKALAEEMERIDELRDELNRNLDTGGYVGPAAQGRQHDGAKARSSRRDLF